MHEEEKLKLKALIVSRGDSRGIKALLEGVEAEVFTGDEPLSERVSKNNYDLAVVEGGLDLITSIKAADPRVEVMVIGGSGEEMEAIRLGAAACIGRPVDAGKLREGIENIRELSATRRETAELERLLEKNYTFAGVVGRNPQMLEIFTFLRRVAPYFKTITILGETGTGKEEVARALHSISPVGKHPFIPCNCGALVENLIESEFFGHRKGAFTGAIADKPGVFEAAGEGTVFLDEIGDLPLSFQPHLLRVLQSGDFRRLGSTQPLKARCRVIAATNKDLAAEVKAGRFREDLYFRITPLTVALPPLRERKDDVTLLHRYLLKKSCQRTGKRILGFSRAAQKALISYDWPGNVRELENVIEKVAILTDGPFIREEDLPENIRESAVREPRSAMPLDGLVKAHIENVLRQCGGNRTHAARVLGLSRRALLRKMEKYGID